MSLQAQAQLPQEREPASRKEPVLWATIGHLRVPAGHYVRISPQYGHRSPHMARRRPYFLLNDSPEKYLSSTSAEEKKRPFSRASVQRGGRLRGHLKTAIERVVECDSPTPLLVFQILLDEELQPAKVSQKGTCQVPLPGRLPLLMSTWVQMGHCNCLATPHM